MSSESVAEPECFSRRVSCKDIKVAHDVVFMDFWEIQRLTVDEGVEISDETPTPVATRHGPMFADNMNAVDNFAAGFNQMETDNQGREELFMTEIVERVPHMPTQRMEISTVRLQGHFQGRKYFNILLRRRLREGSPAPVPSGFNSDDIMQVQRRLCPAWDGRF